MAFFAAASSAAQQPASYQKCSETVAKQPELALTIAEEWIQVKPHPSAYHCRAMALFALKRYEQAAGALAMLEQKLGDSNAVLWSNVVRQQARSWQLAGNQALAITTLTAGIHRIEEGAITQPILGRICADLLYDRSQLYASGGRDLFALQDLDQAITLAPQNPKLLLARATLFASQQEHELAREDISTLDAIASNYPGVSALKEYLNQ